MIFLAATWLVLAAAPDLSWLIDAEIPAQLKDERSVFLELARRHGAYAIVGRAAGKGVSGTRFAFRHAGAKPGSSASRAKPRPTPPPTARPQAGPARRANANLAAPQ